MEATELDLPEFMYGSWHRVGPWLMCYRQLAVGVDILTHMATDHEKLDCPSCLSSSTCRLSIMSKLHPYCWYCTDCGLVWLAYPARCLSCGIFVQFEADELKCPDCGTVWQEDIIKQAHELGDIYCGEYL